MPETARSDAIIRPDQAPYAPGFQTPSGDNELRVSVVIPTYNSAESLRVCLDALSAQDFPDSDFEVFVVDDGSTDNTREVVESYAEAPANIRYWRQEHGGPALARNHGTWRTSGRIVMFTDADCKPCPNWISQMAAPFEEPGSTVAAVKGAYKTRQDGFIARFAQMEFESRYRKMMKREVVDFVDTYSAAFSRTVFTELEGFDTSFPLANNEDVEFSYRMADRGHRMVFNPDAVVYHHHPDTIYRYLRTKFGRAYWRMAVYRTFPEKMKSDSYTPQTLKVQILLAFLVLAGLLGELVVDRGFLIAACAGTLFILSTVPFVLGTVNVAFLNALAARIERWRQFSPIKQLLHAITTWSRVCVSPCRVPSAR